MPNKKINQLDVKVAVSTDLMLVGDPTSGTSFKSTLATLPLVPTSRTITINGVSQDLSANRTYTIDALPSQTGNSGKYLTTNGTVASWGVINLSGYVPYTGATGAVNLGAFDLTVNTLTIGKGNSALSNNTALGYQALFHVTTGNFNTAGGYQSLHNITTGQYNTALGQSSMFTATSAAQNVAIGLNALLYTTSGGSNVVMGVDGLQHNTTGASNVALGYNAGSHITGGSTPNTTSGTSIYIGRDTRAAADGQSNQIVIGHGATGNGSNTATIGNSSITANYFTGSINGGSFVKSGGTSSQFLKADGSVDSTTYATSNIYTADGTLTSARTLTSGGFPLTFTGSNMAATAIARGLNLTHTLVAAANSDVLVGLDINPTFTNGAFTGVNNYGLRVINSQAFFGGLGGIAMFIESNSAIRGNATSGGTIYFDASRDTTGTLNFRGTTLVFPGGSMTTSDFNITSISSLFASQSLILRNAGVSSFRLNNTTSATTWYFESYRNAPSGSLEITNSLTNAGLTMFSTRNVGINTNTDAGFKLDVNGTARVSGALKLFSGVTSPTLNYPLNAYASSGGIASFEYATNGFLQFVRAGVSAGIIRLSNAETYDITFNAGAFGSTLGIAIRPANIGGVKIGGDNTTIVHENSAILNVESTTKGFLPPRMTNAQRTAISSPAVGLIVYCTDAVEGLYIYKSMGWTFVI